MGGQLQSLTEDSRRRVANDYYELISLERWQRQRIRRRQRYEQAARTTWRYMMNLAACFLIIMCLHCLIRSEFVDETAVLWRGWACIIGICAVFCLSNNDEPPCWWVLLHRSAWRLVKWF